MAKMAPEQEAAEQKRLEDLAKKLKPEDAKALTSGTDTSAGLDNLMDATSAADRRYGKKTPQ